MPRITCKTPASGKPITVALAGIGIAYATLAEAPDFSVPDPNTTYPARDPLNPNRAVRPGEVYLRTPVFVRNRDTTTRWAEMQLVLENGTTVACPGRIAVPPGDTVMFPVQGRSLVKRTAAGTYGDRLQVRAEVTGMIDVWASAEEKLSQEHVV